MAGPLRASAFELLGGPLAATTPGATLYALEDADGAVWIRRAPIGACL